MLKFLRKYQGWIMAIGGGLLMIAFLLPQAIQQLGKISHNPEIATIRIDGSTHTLRYQEWQEAAAQLEIVKGMYGTDQVGLMLGFPPADPDDRNGPGLQGADHWYLLREQAKLAGFIDGVADGRLAVEQLAAGIAQAQRVDFDEVLASLTQSLAGSAGEARMTLDDGYRALSVMGGIIRLISNYSGGPVTSDQRTRRIVEDFQRRVNVTMVFVDAAKMLDDEPEPDEQALEEQFQKYKDVEKGQGEQGFGYRLPDRAKVEYLSIDYQSVLDQVHASLLDARKWYARNQDQARSAGGPDGPPEFDAIADDVLLAYRRSLAETKMEEIGRFVKSELTRNVQSLGHDGEWRVLPEDWAQKRASFEELRNKLQDQFGVKVDYTADTSRWYSLSEIGQLEGIGRGLRQVGASRYSFRQLVGSVREFGQVTVPGLQAGLADPALLRDDGFNTTKVGPISFPQTAYLYRVLEVDPARPPRTLDEVREEVVRDVKRLNVYERLVNDADTWRQRALDEGLDELAKSLDVTVLRGGCARYNSGTSRPGDFKPTSIGNITSRTLVDAVLERADQFDELTPIDQLSEEDRLVVVGAPEALGLAIVHLEGQIPVSRETWTRLVDQGMLISGIGGRNAIHPSRVVFEHDFDDPDMSPFSFTAMKLRFDWVERRKSNEEETGKPSSVGGQTETEDNQG